MICINAWIKFDAIQQHHRLFVKLDVMTAHQKWIQNIVIAPLWLAPINVTASKFFNMGALNLKASVK